MSTFVAASATAWAQIVLVNMCRSHALCCECDVPPMLRADVQSFALWCPFPCWELSGWCRVTSDSTDDTLLLFSVDNIGVAQRIGQSAILTQVLYSTDDTLLLFSVENTSIEYCTAHMTLCCSVASCSSGRAEYCVTLTRVDRKALEALLAIFTSTRWQPNQTKPMARWLRTM